MSIKILRIGTRDSELALWQANKVCSFFKPNPFSTSIIKIKSLGDMDLTQPVYSMGIQGVFTKALDIALLENQIDIAVHSLKDVPTKLPSGIVLGAILKRGSAKDVLVFTKKFDLKSFSTIATGSLRRKAQWLNRYPNHSIRDIRGNIKNRVNKLKNSNCHGAIFAKAGLDRIKPSGIHYQELDWMIPSAAQGAIGVVCRSDEPQVIEVLKSINDIETEKCIQIEREFLSLLEGGCTAPIGSHAEIVKNKISFTGGLYSPDGNIAITVSKKVNISEYKNLANIAVKDILKKGGHNIIKMIRK